MERMDPLPEHLWIALNALLDPGQALKMELQMPGFYQGGPEGGFRSRNMCPSATLQE